jgi:hypothetical protein
MPSIILSFDAYTSDRCQINIPYTIPNKNNLPRPDSDRISYWVIHTRVPTVQNNDPKRRDIMLLSHVPIQGHCRDKHNASRHTHAHAHAHTIQSSVINTSRHTHSALLMPLRFIGGYGCVSNHLQLFSPHLARLSLTTTAASPPHPSATPKQWAQANSHQ